MAQSRQFVPLSPTAKPSGIVRADQSPKPGYDLYNPFDVFNGMGNYGVKDYSSQPPMQSQGLAAPPPILGQQSGSPISVSPDGNYSNNGQIDFNQVGRLSQDPNAFALDDPSKSPEARRAAILQAYDQKMRDIMAQAGTRFKSVGDVPAAEFNFNMPTPQRDSDSYNQTMPHALDAALMMSGLGALVGSPGFGTQAGIAALGGAANAATGLDNQAYQAEQSTYDNALKQATNRYGRDVQMQEARVRGITLDNANVQRDLDSQRDAETASLKVQEAAITADEKRQAQEDGKKMQAVIKLMTDGNATPEAMESAAKWLNSKLGTDFYGAFMSNLSPDNQAKLQWLQQDRAERSRQAQLNRENKLAVVKKQIDGTLARQKELDQTKVYIDRKDRENRISLAHIKAAAGAGLHGAGSLSKAAEIAMMGMRMANQNVVKAETGINHAREELSRVMRDKNLVADTPSGFTPQGERALAMAQEALNSAINERNQALGEYNQRSQEFDNRYAEFRNGVAGTKYDPDMKPGKPAPVPPVTTPPPPPQGQGGNPLDGFNGFSPFGKGPSNFTGLFNPQPGQGQPQAPAVPNKDTPQSAPIKKTPLSKMSPAERAKLTNEELKKIMTGGG